jgi:hypothetical protein
MTWRIPTSDRSQMPATTPGALTCSFTPYGALLHWSEASAAVRGGLDRIQAVRTVAGNDGRPALQSPPVVPTAEALRCGAKMFQIDAVMYSPRADCDSYRPEADVAGIASLKWLGE